MAHPFYPAKGRPPSFYNSGVSFNGGTLTGSSNRLQTSSPRMCDAPTVISVRSLLLVSLRFLFVIMRNKRRTFSVLHCFGNLTFFEDSATFHSTAGEQTPCWCWTCPVKALRSLKRLRVQFPCSPHVELLLSTARYFFPLIDTF